MKEIANVYLKGRWLSLLIYFMTHSSIKYFRAKYWTSYCVVENMGLQGALVPHLVGRKHSAIARKDQLM